MVSACGYAIARVTATRANSKPERSGVAKVKYRPAFGSTAQKTFAVPCRSYSLSRRVSRPGSAGDEGRTSACSVTDFSSRQTTGSAGLYGFSYIPNTSSRSPRYSSVSSGTHHIFFPPRLEVVVEQQNPNRFPSHPGNQSPLYGLLGHQAHRPTGAAFWRIATHHSDDPLFLAVVQDRLRTGPRL